MKIAISAETTIDLTNDLKLVYDIKTIPFQITLGDKVFFDGDMTAEQLFKEVDSLGTLPKTCANNEFTYTEYFEGLLKEYDAIIHIALSSGLTSSTQSAINASKNLNNVYIVDSQSLSTGIALLAIYARELTKTIDDPKKIAQLVNDRVPFVQASFIVDRLDYLYKGGRCTGFQLLGANLFKISPRLVLKDGKIISDKKYKGSSMGFKMKNYCADILKEFNNYDNSICFITYTTATEDMLNSAREAVKNAGFTTIYETRAGATVASHCGENTMGILYFNDAKTTLN